MTVRIDALKIAFSAAALALLIGALPVSTSSSTAAEARQSAVQVTGGKTTLKPTKRMIRKLKRAKVRVRPTGSAGVEVFNGSHESPVLRQSAA